MSPLWSRVSSCHSVLIPVDDPQTPHFASLTSCIFVSQYYFQRRIPITSFRFFEVAPQLITRYCFKWRTPRHYFASMKSRLIVSLGIASSRRPTDTSFHFFEVVSNHVTWYCFQWRIRLNECVNGLLLSSVWRMNITCSISYSCVWTVLTTVYVIWKRVLMFYFCARSPIKSFVINC